MNRFMTLGKILIPVLRTKKINWKISIYELGKTFRSGRLLKRSLYINFLPSWMILYTVACKKGENMSASGQYDKIIKIADELYDALKFKEIYELLHKESLLQNDDILWRLARVLYELALVSDVKEERVSLLNEAYSYAEKSIEINENNNNGHRWYAILLDYVAREIGTKERIIKSIHIRKHLEKALEICPTDATALYVLGNWCYMFADLPWYQRKIASVIFATPPTSTFEEALTYFEKAEEIEPNFYSMNLLFLGKTYLKLNQKDKAIIFLEKLKNFPLKTSEDHEALEEANELLKSLK